MLEAVEIYFVLRHQSGYYVQSRAFAPLIGPLGTAARFQSVADAVAHVEATIAPCWVNGKIAQQNWGVDPHLLGVEEIRVVRHSMVPLGDMVFLAEARLP